MVTAGHFQGLAAICWAKCSHTHCSFVPITVPIWAHILGGFCPWTPLGLKRLIINGYCDVFCLFCVFLLIKLKVDAQINWSWSYLPKVEGWCSIELRLKLCYWGHQGPEGKKRTEYSIEMWEQYIERLQRRSVREKGVSNQHKIQGWCYRL